MEAALDVLARRTGATSDEPEVARFPFDARRRLMPAVVGDRVVVKGARDAVFPRCSVPAGAVDALQVLAGRGLRVLAIASRDLDGGQVRATAAEPPTATSPARPRRRRSPSSTRSPTATTRAWRWPT
jgi:magnesium-transporting ATPase (P-type)